MKTLKLTFQGEEVGTVSIREDALLDIVSAAAIIQKPPTASLDVKCIESYDLAKFLDISFPGHTYENF